MYSIVAILLLPLLLPAPFVDERLTPEHSSIHVAIISVHELSEQLPLLPPPQAMHGGGFFFSFFIASDDLILFELLTPKYQMVALWSKRLCYPRALTAGIFSLQGDTEVRKCIGQRATKN